MAISLILLILLWILPKHYNRIYIQRPQSQLLKFIASILVVLGHQTAFYCNTTYIIKSETGVGDLCVAFFLFMSGYGLLFELLSKEHRVLTFNWLINHLFKLIIPALTAMILYTIIKICLDKDINWSHLFIWWFLSNTNLLYGWYITEILTLYLCFFICFHYIKPQLAFKILCLIIVLTMGIMIIVQVPIWYIKGLPCFIMGLTLAKVDVNKKKHKIKPRSTLFIMTLCVIIFYILKDFHRFQEFIPFLDKWRYTYLSFYLINIIFIPILINILMRLPSSSKILTKNYCYYEIYLVQGASLLVCREFIENDIIFIIAGIFSTIIVAKWINLLNNLAINKAKIIYSKIQRYATKKLCN